MMCKKNILAGILIIVLNTAMLLSGCGDNAGNDDVSHSDTAADAEKDTESADTAETENNNSDCADLYQDFLDGKAELSIANADIYLNEWEEQESGIDKNKTYTMGDFLLEYFDLMYEYNVGDYAVEEVYYGYTDQNEAGDYDLVLQFKSYMYDDEYNNICVIRDIDGQLELCAFVCDGYRSYNFINTYGVIGEGGSAGASDWYEGYSIIGDDGMKELVYNSEVCGSYNLYIGSETDLVTAADELGVDDICVTRYAFDEYGEDEYDEDTYVSFMKNCSYTFGRYDESGDLDESDELYSADSNYAKFMDMITDNWYKPDDMDNILQDRLQEKGLTEDMLKENDLDWSLWEGHEDIFADFPRSAQTCTVDNPSWTYYYDNNPYGTDDDFVTLEEVSGESNDIIDEDKWFADNDLISPFLDNNSVIKDPSGDYTYYLSSAYGEYDHMYDTVLIHDDLTDKDLVKLDFYFFITPDEYNGEDASFVSECVEYVQTIDNIVYVSISHRTYSESAPHNAYVMALDMNNDYQVIWKSEPLVCNSDNFAIVGGSLICGYGFTAEPDYIYELNRYTGEKMNTIKVKSGPDYFFEKDGSLYVRTYDTNYVFKICK